MKRTKEKSNEYPKPFESEWMDDGSMTIDLGQKFRIVVDDDGFSATRENGPMSPGDLFGELSYWPKTVVWTGSAKTLGQLLRQLAEANGMDLEEVTAPIIEALDDYEDYKIASYLAEERKAVELGEDLGELQKRWPEFEDYSPHKISGLPSPEIQSESFYNGLTLELNEAVWTASLYSDAADPPELLGSMMGWSGETLDDLLGDEGNYGSLLMYWGGMTRDKLVNLLIEDDPRWRPFVAGTDTTSVSTQESADPR